MFCCPPSKRKQKENQKKADKENERTVPNPIQVQSPQKYDEQIISILQRDLYDAPDWFVLNNVLMSMQFFENYQKDVLKTSHTTASKMEKELNRNLLKNENICTSPDVVFDMVNKNVRFRPLHGPKKYTSEPLGVKRLFVVNDTIEVVNSMDIPHYTSIDKPSYQVKIEESPRKGFVRLKFIDSTKIPKVYDTAYEPRPGSSKDSDSDFYEYTTITELRTPKPLDVTDDVRKDTLPRTCFATKKTRKNLQEWLIENEDNDDAELTEEDMFETVTYVNAKGIMSHFKNALFPNSLGRTLGFDEVAIGEATAIPGKVFCNLYDDDDNQVPCEVVPAVAIDWPEEQTFEFIMREERPTIADWRTGLRYRWPTDEMIKEIRSLSCVLIPTGYFMKKGRDVDSEIEWEIAFPKAERYIESKMSHSQMRCFLFLLAVHKTFIEPNTRQFGLLVEHIRCHMYWECEQDYRDWPEHRLGFKLKKVIGNLIQKITRQRMPDYFIKSKNLFENIPKKYLLVAQEVFHRILESPLMYFVVALRNVRYTNGKFYPPFDFTKLYKVMSESNGMKILNPSALKTPPNMTRQQRKYLDQELQWQHVMQLKSKERYLKKKQKDAPKVEERRVSVDSIDLNWRCEKQFDMYKVKVILQIFISHFVDTAKDSSRLSTKEQASFYLKQASYLTSIMENVSSAFNDEIADYRELISEEEVKIKKLAAKEILEMPPATPVRNSVHQFDFSIAQQVRSNVVDLNNLNNSYNKTTGGVHVKRATSAKMQGSPVARAKKTDRFEKSISFIEPKRG